MARLIAAAFVIAASVLTATIGIVPRSDLNVSAQSPGICGRNSEIQRLILAELARLQTAGSLTNAPTACGNVTAGHLAQITRLSTRPHSSLSPALTIGALASGDFAGLANMVEVSLINVGVTSIGVDTFEGLANTEWIEVTCNDLSGTNALDANAFRGIGSGVNAGAAHRIDLTSNAITSLPATIFKPHTRLTHIRLGVAIADGGSGDACPDKAQNALTSLDADLFRYNTNLTNIHIDGNSLTAINRDQFKYNTKLTTINLEDNDITTMPTEVFDSNTLLVTAFLADNELTAIDPKWFQSKPSLGFVRLAGNKITTLPAHWLRGSMTVTPARGQLWMDGNPITSMHDDAFAGTATDKVMLQQLYLSGTSLTEIPAAFDELTELLILMIQDGSLTVLREDDFVNNTKLALLRFDNSKIAEIEPGAFNGLASLAGLYLNGNEITEIKAGVLTNLPKLNRFWMHRNPINKVADDAFDGSWDSANGPQFALYTTPPDDPLDEIPTGFFKDMEVTPRFVSLGYPPATPYDLPIYVYVVDTDTAKLYMPTGTPIDFTVDLTASDATLTDSGGDPVTSLSFSVGEQSSEEFDFTPSSADARPVITLTPQVTLPQYHFGYEVVNGGQSPPEDVESTTNETTVTLKWSNLDETNNLLHGYEYRFRPVTVDPTEWSEWTLQAVQTGTLQQSATISDLTLGMEYEFELRALSIRGASDPVSTSEMLMVVETPIDDPPGGQMDDQVDGDELELEGLELDADGRVKRIELTWNMPTSTEPIASYRLRHRVLGAAEWGTWIVINADDLNPVNDPPVFMSSISELEPATTYVVQIQALQEETMVPSHSATASATTAWSFSVINRIEPHVRHLTVHTGERVRLNVDVYSTQEDLANSRADTMTGEFSIGPIWYDWLDGGSPGEFDVPSDSRILYYTAQEEPGMHTITAEVGPPGICVSQLETPRPNPDPCVATFTVNVVVIETESEPGETPVDPSGAIPTSITDTNGLAFATASPVGGGSFMDPNSDATLAVPPNAVQNDEVIGVRVDRSPLAMMPMDASGRFAIASDVYIISVIGGQGMPVMGYMLEEPARVCVPVPDRFREQLSDISAVRLNGSSDAGESVEVLQTTLLAGMNGMLTACGAVSNLPARVAAARFGVDPVMSGVMSGGPEGDLPDTGGNAPSATWLLLAMLLGATTLGVGAALHAATQSESRRVRKRHLSVSQRPVALQLAVRQLA